MNQLLLYFLITSTWLTLTRPQLSFEPPYSFYNLEHGTGPTVSCLYDGSVDNRVNWVEDSSVISSTHQLSLAMQSIKHHIFICQYTPITGSVEAKQLIVNVYRRTQLELSPVHLNYSLSTRLTNSTPFYVYCLGYGDPIPQLEWREDNRVIASIPTDSIDTPAEFNTSLAVVDLKRFSTGLHHLSCYGFNGYSSDQIYLKLLVDSSSPLLITPLSDSSLNNTLLYYLDQNSTLTLRCSVRSFSLPPDNKWVGSNPFWTLATSSGIPTDEISNSSTLLLSNSTLGYLACVLRSSIDNATVTRMVHVSFVRPTSTTPTHTSTTPITNTFLNTSTVFNTTTSTRDIIRSNSTLPLNTTYSTRTDQIAYTTPHGNLDTDEASNTKSHTTLDQTSNTPTHVTTYISLSPLIISLIIAGLSTLLCLTLMLLLSIGCLLLCRHITKRREVRKKRRRLSRIQYIDVMEDAYPQPSSILTSLSNSAQQDSNQYSDGSQDETARNHSGGLAQALGVRAHIYERIPADMHVLPAAIQTDPGENAVILTSEQPQTSSDNSVNTTETSI